jgi:D-alanine-D-alanine ligase
MQPMRARSATVSDALPRLSITVLAGGPSSEREVSLESGRAVAEALRKRGHEVVIADISPGDLRALDRAADVIFPALHGTFGEDGQVQRIMERRRLCFVGSGSVASALCMDKLATKRRIAEAGLPTPHCEVVKRANRTGGNTAGSGEEHGRDGRSAPESSGAGLRARASRAAQPLRPHASNGSLPAVDYPPFRRPVVVKPVDQGSSVHTIIARKAAEYEPAIATVLEHYDRAMIEDFIKGDEITVGLLDGEPLPPICIRPKRGFYDYDAKYRDDRTEYLFDTNHPPEVFRQAAAMSKRAWQVLGCRHLARADWMVDSDHRLWFLEINTMPGFTSHSLVPKAAARIGISFEELTERLVTRALDG